MTQSLSDVAYNYILDQIYSRELTDGMKIFEQNIMATLNISRTPVREAVQRLVSDNILDYYPRRYTQVHTFTDREIFDLATVRISIDSLSVQLAILNGSNRDFQLLEKISEECDNAARAKDIKNYIKLDCDFHTELVEVGGNQVLLDLQKRLSLKTRVLQTQSYTARDEVFCELSDHQSILTALYARNVADALHYVQRHLSSFYNRISTDGTQGRSTSEMEIKIPNYDFSNVHIML